MKHLLLTVFKSKKFLAGFIIFMGMFLLTIIYPIISFKEPLKIYGGLFYPPGTYVSVSDAVDIDSYTIHVDVKDTKLKVLVSEEDRQLMKDWLLTFVEDINADELEQALGDEVIELYLKHFDPEHKMKGFTKALKNQHRRLYKKIQNILNSEGYILALNNPETGELEIIKEIKNNQFVNIDEVPNRMTFPFGTDNFGRDVLSELVAAIKTSLKIGLLAGTVATLIGLLVGLLAGYVGGVVDNILTFITNMFTVIPSFVILILIASGLGQQGRGTMLVATVIGLTAWPWTARSVRSQTISLRNRDHVNLSKLSGHSLPRIILTDILPYIASYVVMAYVLQVASGILSEAQLSMLGLGPSTTKEATLGLMMNWAMQFQAPLSGAWWAFLPVVLSIALITFSLNLMNTGLDQVFNPQLRE